MFSHSVNPRKMQPHANDRLEKLYSSVKAAMMKFRYFWCQQTNNENGSTGKYEKQIKGNLLNFYESSPVSLAPFWWKAPKK